MPAVALSIGTKTKYPYGGSPGSAGGGYGGKLDGDGDGAPGAKRSCKRGCLGLVAMADRTTHCRVRGGDWGVSARRRTFFSSFFVLVIGRDSVSAYVSANPSSSNPQRQS